MCIEAGNNTTYGEINTSQSTSQKVYFMGLEGFKMFKCITLIKSIIKLQTS